MLDFSVFSIERIPLPLTSNLFITPSVACNTTGQRQCELYFGHTGNHYFALKKKAR